MSSYTLDLEHEISRLEVELERAKELCDGLQSQLQEAQSECQEQARLNGMGTERELALQAKLAEARAIVELQCNTVIKLNDKWDASEAQLKETRMELEQYKNHRSQREVTLQAEVARLQGERSVKAALIEALQREANENARERDACQAELERVKGLLKDWEETAHTEAAEVRRLNLLDERYRTKFREIESFAVSLAVHDSDLSFQLEEIARAALSRGGERK